MNSTKLSQDQIAEFHEQGFLILPAVFTDAEIADMAHEADRLLELAINAALATGEQDPRCDMYATADGGIDFRKLQPVNDLSDAIRAASEDDRLLVPLSQLMGDQNPVLMEEKLNYKQKISCPAYLEKFSLPTGDARFALHHDWGYYRAQGYPSETLSSSVTIDATTPDNGPIRVIPGTHKQDYPMKDPDPAHGNGEIEDGVFAPDNRVDVLAPAGSVMLFHSKLVHDSKPNTTAQPRRLMIYSHYPGNWSFEEDKRNRWSREAGQKVENAYRQKVARGEYTDVFAV